MLCLITLVFSILEGINIGLLIPLLETLQSDDGAGSHWISRLISSFFGSFGVPLNLNTMLAALGIIVLIISGLKYCRLILAAKAQANLTIWVRSRNMQTLLYADAGYFHKKQLGVLSDTLTTQANRSGNSLFIVAEIVSNVGVITTYLVAALLISPGLTMIALALLLVVTILMQWHISNAKTLGTVRTESETNLQASALENLSGINVIKSFLIEQSRLFGFIQQANQVRDNQYNLVKNQSQMTILQELSLFALIALIIYVGFSALSVGIPVIVALLFTLYRLAPRISGTNNRRQQLAANLASLHQVNQILAEANNPKVKNGNRSIHRLEQKIELRNISFHYDDNPLVLKGASFTIDKGQMTAIIGASGAGKSTIIDLILRFFDPTEGTILVDGIDLQEIDITTWRTRIGIVSQDTFLFNDTIRNNISLGRIATGNKTVEYAAKQAYADKFINQLSEGYETIIGDRGLNLSGGERQRISLARAIMSDPEILILDEATSSLDTHSEQLIQQYIEMRRGDCTLIVVAHRTSTIQSADKIVVVKDGGIIQEGPPERVLVT